MKFLLDTDAFSEIVKQRNRPIAERMAEIASGDVATSVVTIGEVRFGAFANPALPRGLLARIDALSTTVRVLPLGLDAATKYAELRAELQLKGTPIGPNDLWIAAHALALDLTLVTGNEREFARVPTLRVENWMR